MKRTAAIIMLMGLCLTLRAQSALSFAALQTDAKGLSMSKVLEVPSLMGSKEAVSASAGYRLWSPGNLASSNFDARFSLSREGFSAGADLLYAVGDEYESFNADGFAAGKFTPSQYRASAYGAYCLSERLSLGARLSYAGQNLAEDGAFGAAFADLSATYKLAGTTLSAGLATIGAPVKDAAGNAFALPSSAFADVACRLGLPSDLSAEAGAQMQYFFDGAVAAGAGVDIAWNSLLHVRCGYYLATEKSPVPSFLSLGTGLDIKGLKIDLCYIASGLASGSLAFNLGYSF